MSSETQRVVKHNDLVKARSNLSKIEHRVIAMLIAQLDRDDESFDLQRIHIRDIIAKSGSSSQDLYNRGKEICQRLLNQQIQIQTEGEDGQRVYEGYNALDKIRYAEGDQRQHETLSAGVEAAVYDLPAGSFHAAGVTLLDAHLRAAQDAGGSQMVANVSRAPQKTFVL